MSRTGGSFSDGKLSGWKGIYELTGKISDLIDRFFGNKSAPTPATAPASAITPAMKNVSPALNLTPSATPNRPVQQKPSFSQPNNTEPQGTPNDYHYELRDDGSYMMYETNTQGDTVTTKFLP